MTSKYPNHNVLIKGAGDVDPNAEPAQCQHISDKAYVIAGVALEAVLRAWILPTRASSWPESLTSWEEETLRAYNR